MNKKFILLSPACFLAIAFHKSKRNFLTYDWLNNYRSKIREKSNSKIDVDWDHDSVNYTMGLFSPIFSSNNKGVSCNFTALDRYYYDITQEISKKIIELLEDCVYLNIWVS